MASGLADSVRKHFEGVQPSILQEMLKANELSADSTKSDLAIDCQKAVLQLGVDELFKADSGLLDASQIAQLSQGLSNNQTIRGELLTDLVGAIGKIGAAGRSILQSALDTSDDQATTLCEQVFINGADAFLSNLGPDLLKRAAAEFKISASVPPEDLVETIIDIMYPPQPAKPSAPPKDKQPKKKKDKEKEKKEKKNKEKKSKEKKKEKKEESSSKKTKKAPSAIPQKEFNTYDEYLDHLKRHRPALKKGISLDDIQNCYWVDEIRDFCKDNGLKITGKKAQLNKRVAQFLNDGIVDAPAGPKKKAAKKKPAPKRPKKEETAGDDAGAEEPPAKQQKTEAAEKEKEEKEDTNEKEEKDEKEVKEE